MKNKSKSELAYMKRWEEYDSIKYKIPTTPEELNAAVFEALGWKLNPISGRWLIPGADPASNAPARTPNVAEDLNACFKWVVPSFRERFITRNLKNKIIECRLNQMRHLIGLSMEFKTPATYLCKEFLKMEGWEL